MPPFLGRQKYKKNNAKSFSKKDFRFRLIEHADDADFTD